MMIKVRLPNGSELEVENNLTLEQIREVVAAAGVANVALAPAVEGTDREGNRTVVFNQPQGATKG
jgi:hypothetical protein